MYTYCNWSSNLGLWCDVAHVRQVCHVIFHLVRRKLFILRVKSCAKFFTISIFAYSLYNTFHGIFCQQVCQMNVFCYAGEYVQRILAHIIHDAIISVFMVIADKYCIFVHRSIYLHQCVLIYSLRFIM